jgi:hypothetical protein
VVWEYDGDPTTPLNKPSLAIELPNGNILTNDDYNHRVIVIDKNTKQIIWQYGITGKPGSGVDQLNTPDGLDIIKRDSVSATSTSNSPLPISTPPAQSVGSVTRHAASYIGKSVVLQGYLLKSETGDIIFSDEPTGSISIYDLPVTGNGITSIVAKHEYLLQGTFIKQSLPASNGSTYRLELSNIPTLLQ